MMELETGTAGQANELIARHGLAVVRHAFDPRPLALLVAAAQDYLVSVQTALRAGRFEMPQRFNFNDKTYAADWVALDPDTKDRDVAAFNQTLMYRAIVDGVLREVVGTSIGAQVGWSLARARVVLSSGAKTGAINLHQERNFMKQPGTHNIWMVLSDGAIANRDTPGIEFFVGHRDELLDTDRAVPMIASIHAASARGETRCGDGFFYRPELAPGDAVIFDSAVMHGSFIPPTAHLPRVSFDVRGAPAR